MKNFTKLTIARSLLSICLVMPAFAQASFIYVGSYNVFDGPTWFNNPQVYTGREAAALLFGGSPLDYAISTVNDINNITNTAWVDGNGDDQYLLTAVSQDFSLSSLAGGGYNPGPAYSAYVCDHADCQDYGFPVSAASAGFNYTNFVFRNITTPVPEPATFALLGLGLAGFSLSRNQRKAG